MKIRAGILFLLTLSLLSAALPVTARPAPWPEMYSEEPFFFKPTIDTLTVMNPEKTFAAGTVVRIRMTGTPGAIATFAVAGVQKDIPMAEISRGVYEGLWVVPADRDIYNAQLTGSLEFGGKTTAEATSRLNIGDGHMFVRIYAPSMVPTANHALVIKGSTVPNAEVSVLATVLDASGTSTMPIAASGLANASGSFSIPLHLGGQVAKDGRDKILDLTVFATDGIGVTSQEVDFRLATGH